MKKEMEKESLPLFCIAHSSDLMAWNEEKEKQRISLLFALHSIVTIGSDGLISHLPLLENLR